MPAITTRKKPHTKPATEAARQLFLYGEGDGVRVLEVKDLIAKTGLSRQTIQNHLPKWQQEVGEVLQSTSKLASPNSLSLSSETLEAHKADIAFIRKQLDESKSEIERLPVIISDLEGLVQQFVDDSDKAIVLLDRYLRTSMNKKSLTKRFVELKLLWDSKSGVDSLKNIQEATAKAVSIASAKSEPSEQQEGVVPVSGGVFSKRG